MALNPYPSLATLPEVIANGGRLAARLIDAFAARTIYASSIAGVVLDCDVATGSKVAPQSGILADVAGTPTDNAPAINAVLATASATNHVHLIVDGGCAIGSPILIPPGGHVTLAGHGWDTGFYVLPGSNCSAIQNYAHTNLAEYLVWNPTGAQSVTGSDLTIRDLRINGNRGTYPDGNCNGTIDGTLAGYTPTGSQPPTTLAPDARGLYTDAYWLSGIALVGLDKVLIEGVWVYDAPAYHVNLYHCTNVRIHRCRIETPNNTGTTGNNTDGVHCNGGCSHVDIAHCYFRTGDDPFAFNVDEGDRQPGNDFSVSHCYLDDCLTGGRVYGCGTATDNVSFSHLRGSFRINGFSLCAAGDNAIVGVETNKSISFEDVWLAKTVDWTDTSMIRVAENIGILDVRNCRLIDPTLAVPMVEVVAGTVSELRMSGCAIKRSSSADAAAYALLMTGGAIGDLSVDGFRYGRQAGQAFSDCPVLFDVQGGSIDRFSLSADVYGVATLAHFHSGVTCNGLALEHLVHSSDAGSPTAYAIVADGATVPVSIGRVNTGNLAGLASGNVQLSGPGLASCGFALADSAVANGSVYDSSTQSALCYRSGGVSTPISLGSAPAATGYTLTGPSSGTVGVASSNFTVQPNGVYSGTITITPSGGGLSTPIVKTFSASSAPQTFTITPTSPGAVTLTPTNNGSLANPSALTYTASAALTTYLEDDFAGTPGAAVLGRTPAPTPNGSDVWGTSPAESAGLVIAPGGSGAIGTGTGGHYGVLYPLTGAPYDQTVDINFEAFNVSSNQVMTARFLCASDFTSLVEVDVIYANNTIQVGKVQSGTYTANVHSFSLADAGITLAANAAYHLRAVFSGNGTSLALSLDAGSGLVAIGTVTGLPTATATGINIAQAQGVPGDMIFTQVKVTG